jgi:hypothetical protein
MSQDIVFRSWTNFKGKTIEWLTILKAGDQALLSHVNIDKAEAVTDVNTDKAKKLLKDRELC